MTRVFLDTNTDSLYCVLEGETSHAPQGCIELDPKPCSKCKSTAGPRILTIFRSSANMHYTNMLHTDEKCGRKCHEIIELAVKAGATMKCPCGLDCELLDIFEDEQPH